MEGTEEVQWRLLQRGETWSELTLSFFLLWHLPNVILKKLYLFAFGFAGSLLLLGLFSSCSKQGLFFIALLGASQGGGFSRCRAQALGTRAFSTCDTRAQ